MNTWDNIWKPEIEDLEKDWPSLQWSDGNEENSLWGPYGKIGKNLGLEFVVDFVGDHQGIKVFIYAKRKALRHSEDDTFLTATDTYPDYNDAVREALEWVEDWLMTTLVSVGEALDWNGSFEKNGVKTEEER